MKIHYSKKFQSKQKWYAVPILISFFLPIIIDFALDSYLYYFSLILGITMLFIILVQFFRKERWYSKPIIFIEDNKLICNRLKVDISAINTIEYKIGYTKSYAVLHLNTEIRLSLFHLIINYFLYRKLKSYYFIDLQDLELNPKDAFEKINSALP